MNNAHNYADHRQLFIGNATTLTLIIGINIIKEHISIDVCIRSGIFLYRHSSCSYFIGNFHGKYIYFLTVQIVNKCPECGDSWKTILKHICYVMLCQ